MQQTNLKKYNTKHDWVGKLIHWELCKRLKFDLTTKWYTHKSESIPENETVKDRKKKKKKKIKKLK